MLVKSGASPVYTVYTLGAITTRIAVALVDINLAVGPRGARLAPALVTVDEVLTQSSKLARVTLTLIDLCLTKVTGKTRMAVTRE